MAHDKFYDHDDPKIPSKIIASVYHDIDMPWDELEKYRGGWKDPKWMDIPCVLKKIVQTQFPLGKFSSIRLRSLVFFAIRHMSLAICLIS